VSVELIPGPAENPEPVAPAALVVPVVIQAQFVTRFAEMKFILARKVLRAIQDLPERRALLAKRKNQF
jgi:hypothetical protein